ncbi:MAG: DUF3859 domain-containing protein [Xanthobacteraceae bacterium]|nr:DUF3859 domain-containing protein [Xanthobacteraceae bacterium]MBX3523606.1 DUF3859 domain-containing protein [Xanthobacteraceae bacterium]MCW5674398.1 DUF3859 domain-containing protein [Xanthobacteraceae bacterium]
MFRFPLPGTMKLLLTLFIISVPLSAATAQQISVRKLWYGIYTVKESKEIPDPTSPTGTRYENTGVVGPRVNSSDIEREPRIYFGFGYRVDGSGTIEEIYMLPDANGNRRDEPAFRQTRSVRPGEENFIGWYTGNGESKGNPLGTWTFQLRQNGRVLVEHTFYLTDR